MTWLIDDDGNYIYRNILQDGKIVEKDISPDRIYSNLLSAINSGKGLINTKEQWENFQQCRYERMPNWWFNLEDRDKKYIKYREDMIRFLDLFYDEWPENRTKE